MDCRLLNERDIEFMLYEFLESEALLERPRYREHSRQIFDQTITTAQQIAVKYFANHYHKGDACEPQFDGKNLSMIPETKQAWQAFAEAGFLAAHHDFKDGGMQMPEVILRAAMAYFSAANIATAGYPFLTIGAANLIKSYASELQRDLFFKPMIDGRFAGTMALTEPEQGSSLGDIKTYAVMQADGSYKLYGQKMFISGGEQNITENIVHMVLAKIQNSEAGGKGISLFLCPKVLVNKDGSLGEANDVSVAGLLHKMGYRNTTSTVLNFGEKQGAVGYLVGEPQQGLSYMFQMMNEARIGVGLGASVLGYQGFNCALEYAKQRPQGRLPSNGDPTSTQVKIIEHADVKRMLLAQKVYSEGALSLCLYASSLHEDSSTAETSQQRAQALTLLNLLTPIVKSWPSKYALQANDLAIQVLAGSGYTREYPVEQYYRDNRLNPIHEGTEGIQGLDLLGRKLPMEKGLGIQILCQEIQQCVIAAKQFVGLKNYARDLTSAMKTLQNVSSNLIKGIQLNVDKGLANATLYLDFFGRIVVAWLWLKQAIIASEKMSLKENIQDTDFYRGKVQATKFYFEWELPQIYHQQKLLDENNQLAYEMQSDWF